MKRNLYYRTVYGRVQMNQKIAGGIITLLSIPKIIPDVFLRRNMGERYYSPVIAAIVGIGLFYLGTVFRYAYYTTNMTLYYAFLIAYAVMSVIRYIEIRREPSVFDFAKFSLSTGLPYGFFKNIKLMGKTPSMRTIEIYYEPILFLIPGLLLLLSGQYGLGIILAFSAFSYFFSNLLSAKLGDHFVMDKIDEIICNQELSETFIQNKEVSPRQVPFYGRKPTTDQLREEFADQVLNNDDDDDAAVAV